VNAVTALKRLGLALAALIVIAFGSIWVLSFFISVDAVREQAKAEIRAATGLEPVFRGQSSVRLFPAGSVTFHDVLLADGKNSALVAERLVANLRFFPLLLGHVETADVMLEHPTITVDIERSGHSNWATLLDRLVRGRGDKLHARQPIFSAVRIQDGTVILNDKTKSSVERFDHVNMSLAWPGISKSFGATGHFDWRGETLEGSVTLADFSAALSGAASGIKLRLTGQHGKLAFDGNLSTKPTLKISGVLAADSPSLRKTLLWAGANAPPGGGFEKVAIKADTNVVGGTVALSNVNIELDHNRAEGVLTFAFDGRRTLQGTLAADMLDLRPYVSAIKFVDADQREWNDGHVSLDGMTGFDVDLRLSAATVLLSNAKLGRTAIAANLRDGQLVLTVGESQAFGGIIKGAITLGDIANGLNLKSQLQFSDVDLDSCLTQLFNLRRLEGKGNISLAVSGTGDSILGVTRTLNGTVNLVGTDGALVGLNVEQLLRRLERRPLSGGAELHTGRTPYQRIEIGLNITNGKVTVDDVKIEGSAVRLALGGSASIPARNLNLTGTATLLSAATGNDFELPFVVQGSWDDPIVLPDAQLLIRRSGAAAPLLNAVRGHLNRDTVRSAIERLTGQTGAAPAPADTAPQK
jgi:AsmA protein